MTDHRDKPALGVPIEQYLRSHQPVADQELMWAQICAKRTLRDPAAQRGTQPALPVPVGEALLQSDQLAMSRGRLWRQVRARASRTAQLTVAPRVWPRRLALAGAFAVLCACLLLVADRSGVLKLPGREPSALARADGQPLQLLEAGSEPLSVRFSDQSEIRLSPGASVQPLLSSSSRFELLVRRGSAEFSVTPGGPRRWRVEAGAASVEVVGTVFRVERGAARVRVSVSRGVVLVRGENVPGWVQRITAGQRIEVPSTKPSAQLKPASAPVVAVAPPVSTPAEEVVTEPSVEPLAVPSAPRAARRVQRIQTAARAETSPRLTPTDAYAALGADGMLRETLHATSIARLLELADIARRSGHPRDAVVPLTRALEAFGSSPQAGLAAFTLGRVQLDQLGDPAAAARAFEGALTLEVPRALLADCYRRLSEAYARAGNASAKAAAEARFRSAFPDAASP